MKKILLIFATMLVTYTLSAQHNIKLTVCGQGATKEEATSKALRSAIEQAFGEFVSANTQILNDEIVKEEIATIASGNIKEYQELGCVTLPSGEQSVSLAATVSLSNLISYSKSKGSSAEFAGATFAMNIRMRKLNAKNEITALYNMLEQLYMLAPAVFDWDLEVKEPQVLSEKKYEIPMTAKAKVNSNTSSFFSLLINTLKSLSLSPEEVEGYKANNMAVYDLYINDCKFILRNDYRAFTTYVEYLINCVGEAFQIYGQFGDQKTKLFYDLTYRFSRPQLIKWRQTFSSDPYTYTIDNFNTLMSGAPGAIAFQRDLVVSLNEDALYQLCGLEVVPAPNISRISFVQKDGKMVVDTMNVYQAANFDPDGSSGSAYREAFRQMRVLYVSEDCPAYGGRIDFNNYDCLQTVIIERLSEKKLVHEINHGHPEFRLCDNLETVRIGKGMRYVLDFAFEGNPKLSTVILGSTLTLGDNVVDLMALPEKDLKDLQGVVIFGDEVKSIGCSNSFGIRNASKNSFSVVVYSRNVRCDYGVNFFPSVKFAICPNPDLCNIGENHDLRFIPKERLSYYQNKYPYHSKKYFPLEDKISGLGYVDFLSFLKALSRETVNVE